MTNEEPMSNCCSAPFTFPGFPDSDVCSECLEHADVDEEEEYSVTIKASFGVMAVSQEDAERYILDQFYSGNTGYTCSVEVDNE